MGVFIAQRLTYPLATIPILPPNCPKYRIFHGLFGNIKRADSMDYSWPDMWASVSLQVLHRLMPSTGASALALRQASPSLFFCLVSLRPCTFAVYPSHLCRARADRRFVVGGPSPMPLRLETIASMSSRDRIMPRHVPVASHSGRRWLPQQ